MKLTRISLVSFALLTGFLTGCANNAPHKLTHSPEFAPIYPAPVAKSNAPTGSIFNSNSKDNWFGRAKTYQVGDIVTVHLNEETTANRTASSKLGRNANNNVIPQGVIDRLAGLALPGKVLGTRLEGALTGLNLGQGTDGTKINHDSTGNLDEKFAELKGALTVTVVEVLQNGNLMVRGEKQMAITDGSEVIQISGIIRPSDISSNNMVQSSRLANAQFSYRSTGALANATSPGWGTKLLMNIWPF